MSGVWAHTPWTQTSAKPSAEPGAWAWLPRPRGDQLPLLSNGHVGFWLLQKVVKRIKWHNTCAVLGPMQTAQQMLGVSEFENKEIY